MRKMVRKLWEMSRGIETGVSEVINNGANVNSSLSWYRLKHYVAMKIGLAQLPFFNLSSPVFRYQTN